jgi:hypothetical protein
LSTLSEQEIIAFDKILERCIALTYTSKFQGEAYLIIDSGSEDSFDYFRGWLITREEQVFERKLSDPDPWMCRDVVCR